MTTPIKDIDTQIESLLDGIFGKEPPPSLINPTTATEIDIQENIRSEWRRRRKEAHKAIKALLIQQKGGLDKPDVAQVGGNQVDKPSEGYIKVQLDYAPTTNGKKFAEWCEKYGFSPLNSGRRAWCSSLSTYLRGAAGVAFNDGEMFLFYADDVVTDLATTDHKPSKTSSNPPSKASLKRELT